jgi:hypothetical protein
MKRKFDILLEQLRANKKPLFENAQVTAAHDKVVIDPKALAANKEDIIKQKSASYYAQLEALAQEGAMLTVTAIKRVNQSTGNAVDMSSRTFQEEVDVVSEMNPGNYHSPMSLPLTILKKVTDYNGSFNIPLKDKYRHKPNLDSETHDEYNKGKQPKGTRNNGRGQQ